MKEIKQQQSVGYKPPRSGRGIKSPKKALGSEPADEFGYGPESHEIC
jgi:hypothetical protein